MELFKIVSLTFPLLLPGIVLIAVLKLKLFTFLDVPLDFGIKLYGKPIFGKNKTFKGAIVMVCTSILVSAVLHDSYQNNFIQYINQVFSNSPFLIGILYSFSYILGELINSFVKRQLSISAGKTTSSGLRNIQTFFDLSDGIIVTVITLLIFTTVSAYQVVTAGIIGILLHYCTDVYMRKHRLKDEL